MWLFGSREAWRCLPYLHRLSTFISQGITIILWGNTVVFVFYNLEVVNLAFGQLHFSQILIPNICSLRLVLPFNDFLTVMTCRYLYPFFNKERLLWFLTSCGTSHTLGIKCQFFYRALRIIPAFIAFTLFILELGSLSPCGISRKVFNF